MEAITVTANSNQFEVLAIKAPECSTICAGTNSKQNGYDMYQMVILSIINFFGVSWTAENIKECALMLYDDYYWFTLAELKHFMLMCKSLKYGKIYGQMNPATLIDWMGQYSEESLKIREQNALSAANDERYNERCGSHDDRIGEQIIEDSVRGQMSLIKSQLKNKDNGK